MVNIARSLCFVKRSFRVFDALNGAIVLPEATWRGTAAKSSKSLWRTYFDSRPAINLELYGLFSIESYHEDFDQAITDLCMISHNTSLLKVHALEQALLYPHPLQFVVKQVTFVNDQLLSVLLLDATHNYQLSCIYGGKYGCHIELLAQQMGATKNKDASDVLECDHLYEDGAMNA
jgi:hypothetical protein